MGSDPNPEEFQAAAIQHFNISKYVEMLK